MSKKEALWSKFEQELHNRGFELADVMGASDESLISSMIQSCGIQDPLDLAVVLTMFKSRHSFSTSNQSSSTTSTPSSSASTTTLRPIHLVASSASALPRVENIPSNASNDEGTTSSPASDPTPCGHDVDMFVQPPPNRLICAFCTDVVRDPVRTPCNHVFCRECMSLYLARDGNTCPHDRTQIARSDLVEDVLVTSVVSDLVVSCNNKVHGCMKTVALSVLESHLKVCSTYPPCDSCTSTAMCECSFICPKCVRKDYSFYSSRVFGGLCSKCRDIQHPRSKIYPDQVKIYVRNNTISDAQDSVLRAWARGLERSAKAPTPLDVTFMLLQLGVTNCKGILSSTAATIYQAVTQKVKEDDHFHYDHAIGPFVVDFWGTCFGTVYKCYYRGYSRMDPFNHPLAGGRLHDAVHFDANEHMRGPFEGKVSSMPDAAFLKDVARMLPRLATPHL